MKKPLLTAILFLSFFALITATGCKKSSTTNSAPTLTTQDVILDLTATSAQSGGTVTSIGSSAITANGVVIALQIKRPPWPILKRRTRRSGQVIRLPAI
jgi:hypothetical protein